METPGTSKTPLAKPKLNHSAFKIKKKNYSSFLQSVINYEANYNHEKFKFFCLQCILLPVPNDVSWKLHSFLLSDFSAFFVLFCLICKVYLVYSVGSLSKVDHDFDLDQVVWSTPSNNNPSRKPIHQFQIPMTSLSPCIRTPYINHKESRNEKTFRQHLLPEAKLKNEAKLGKYCKLFCLNKLSWKFA
jgi:hypothetical protein